MGITLPSSFLFVVVVDRPQLPAPTQCGRTRGLVADELPLPVVDATHQASFRLRFYFSATMGFYSRAPISPIFPPIGFVSKKKRLMCSIQCSLVRSTAQSKSSVHTFPLPDDVRPVYSVLLSFLQMNETLHISPSFTQQIYNTKYFESASGDQPK